MTLGHRQRARLGAAAALVSAAALLFAACGGGSTSATPTKAASGTTPAAGASPATASAAKPDFGSLSGSVVIDGSSTVGPIAEAAAEEFGKVSKVKASVGISGTGGGFEKFCKGETDISDASRPIKDSEKTACAGAGVEFVELKIGVDGLTVVANPGNTWATCLTWSQLRKIFDEGSTVNNWNQVDPSFPDQALKIFSPGADSGTFDFLTEQINGKVDKFRNDAGVTFSEDDNVLVTGVQRDKGAIGYFGYAYYVENKATLKAIQVDKGQDAAATPVATDKRKGCVGPSDSTVLDNSYSLSRPLFMYVNKKSLTQKAQVKGFLQFVLTNPDLVSEVGYVRVPDADYTAGLGKLDAN